MMKSKRYWWAGRPCGGTASVLSPPEKSRNPAAEPAGFLCIFGGHSERTYFPKGW
jgi:hypothetical protein